jgi:hypothetical protein
MEQKGEYVKYFCYLNKIQVKDSSFSSPFELISTSNYFNIFIFF